MPYYLPVTVIRLPKKVNHVHLSITFIAIAKKYTKHCCQYISLYQTAGA